MKNKFLYTEQFSIYDSLVNYIEITEKDEKKFVSNKADFSKLSPCKYPLEKMKVGDSLEYHNTTFYFRQTLQQTAREWVKRNKLNWKFISKRVIDKVYLKRIK